MRMSHELILAALASSTHVTMDTETVLALCCDMAAEAGWPARMIAGWSQKQLVPMLRYLQSKQLVQRHPHTTWTLHPNQHPSKFPVPPPPNPGDGKGHPLDDLSRDQLLTVFETQSDALASMIGLVSDTLRSSSTFAERFAEIQHRAMRRLAAAGLVDRVGGAG